MSLVLKNLIRQGFALVFIHDFLPMSNSKQHILQTIKRLYDIASKENLKLALGKSLLMLLTVENLGH